MREEHCVLEEREAVELTAFLITSAHGLATEPTEYGAMRLLEAARRLSRYAASESSDRTTALFDTLEAGISAWMQERHRDPRRAAAVLDESCRAIARYLKEQASESEAQDGD
jgi:phage gp36-like protein